MMNTITSHRDTDFLVANHLDDCDLINLCRAVPTLTIGKNDMFWRNRLLTKYGHIDKADNKSWKILYLQLIYYMDKGKNWDQRMRDAAKGGHRDLVDYFISKGANNWDWGMGGAAQGCHRELVDYFISKGADSWNWGMRAAAQGGHRELVDYFISKGANKWNWGMIGAAEGGHRDLVDYFISRGASNWNGGMIYAAQGGHRELVEFFQQKVKHNL